MGTGTVKGKDGKEKKVISSTDLHDADSGARGSTSR